MIVNIDNNDKDYLWTILYMSGYLTKDKDQEGVLEGNIKLRIPNNCIKSCLKEHIKWILTHKNPTF